MEPSTRCWVVLGLAFLAGVSILIAGVLALTVAPRFIDNVVIQKDWLGEDVVNGTAEPNPTTVKWLHPPYEMRMHIWMYNVTNEKVYLKGGKANLRQKGPYVFVEDQQKKFHMFSEDGTRVIYRNTHRYFFSQNLSCSDCHLTDSITIPNVVFQKLVDAANQNFLFKFAIESALTVLRRESPFITTTVGEALFEGYDDPLLKTICKNSVLSAFCKLLSIPDRIGFFYGQNDTIDGTYEVNTGKKESWMLGHVYSWNNASSLPESWWDSPYARMINGTDAQLFPPLLKSTDRLSLFASQACRTVEMEYASDSSFRGIPAFRFSVPASLYDPALPQNSIFCRPKTTPSFFSNESVQLPGCLPAGLLDLSGCQPGNPRVYLSQAHFLNSPQQVWDAVSGLDVPAADNDLTYVDIEPTSGVPVAAKRVMQVNVGMGPSNLRVLSAAKPVIMPVFWVNETAWVDDDTRDMLVNQLLLAKHFALIGGIAATTVGCLIVIAIVIFVSVEKASQSQSGFLRLHEEAAEGIENPAAEVDGNLTAEG